MGDVDFRVVPKVELHLHLDCALSFQSVAALVPGISLERYQREYVAPKKCRNLSEYLRFLDAPQALLQTREALILAMIDVIRQLADDGVVYAEIRFAPHLHVSRGLRPEEVVEAVLEGKLKGEQLYPVVTRLILATLRFLDTASGMLLVALAERYASDGIGGIDLAGDEAHFSLDPHVPVFRAAAERGVRTTAHAGEALGADSVREVLERLRVARIGHGVRSIEDMHVVEMLVEHNVHIEVCPSCNVQLSVYPTFEDHPIDRLKRAGVSVGVNTDARGPTELTLAHEYARLQEVFQWKMEDFRLANRRALTAAFIDDATRESLSLRLSRPDLDGERQP